MAAMIMDSSTDHILHHLQDMDSSQTLESILVCSKPQPDKKPRPAEEALKCPRCDSINTKFCYYNNYSLSQPRYFCKSCRRYWTKGGTLRNVPVGGGCRRNRRPSSSSSKRSSQDHALTPIPSPPIPALANIPYNTTDSSHDLNLALAKQLQNQNAGRNFPIMGTHDDQNMPNYGGIFEAMRGGFLENPFSVHDLYYAGNVGMGMSGSQEMGMGFDEYFSGTAAASTSLNVKQETGNARDQVLWGFPWQDLAGDGKVKEVDPAGRVSWNGTGSIMNWPHGLLNGTLM